MSPANDFKFLCLWLMKFTLCFREIGQNIEEWWRMYVIHCILMYVNRLHECAYVYCIYSVQGYCIIAKCIVQVHSQQNMVLKRFFKFSFMCGIYLTLITDSMSWRSNPINQAPLPGLSRMWLAYLKLPGKILKLFSCGQGIGKEFCV